MQKMSPTRIALPLDRAHMPGDFRYSLDAYVGREGRGGGFKAGEQRIPQRFGEAQSLQGFEAHYQNIIDYIVRITYRIWEDRDVDYIAQTYSDDSCVYDDYGLQLGDQKIISDTHHTTGAFSNIRLIADEVIWAGDDEIGFHTSHRTLIRGTNDGDSKYGPATGIDIDVLVIANCVALENEIFLEHVLYNNSSMLLQLGFDLAGMAETMVDNPPAGWPRDTHTWNALRNATSPPQALSVIDPVSGFDVDAFCRQCFDQLWNRRNYALLEDCYAAGFEFRGPTERVLSGIPAYHGFLAGFAAEFPDLELRVDEVYWMGNEQEGFLSSTRWSAVASHQGSGLYGAATGRPVQIWGITQQKIINGRVVAEWMLFNELDLMMQIAAARK